MAMAKCDDKICNNGSTYWAVTQMCSQDKLWTIPNPRVPIAREGADMCYCQCVAGKRYCFQPDCVSNITPVILACTSDQIAYQDFVTMMGNDGTGSTDCQCPCPHPMCYFCNDPDIAEYVKTSCDDSSWWPGYPMVMSAGGGNLCTCLCPDDAAKAMRVAAPDGTQAMLHTTHPGDQIMAAGKDLQWKATEVETRTRMSNFTPTIGIKLSAGEKAVTLIPDQLVLNADKKLVPAITVATGDKILGSDGAEMVITKAEHLPVYAYPIPFLALGHDAPDDNYSGRLIDLNGFVIGDYSTQIHSLVMGLSTGLIKQEIHGENKNG